MRSKILSPKVTSYYKRIIKLNRFLGSFNNFFRGLKNLYVYRKLIWNDRDFDDSYLIDLIRFKLVRMKQWWEKGEYYTLDSNAHFCIQRINTLIKMLDEIITNEKYAYEYMNHIEKVYGKEEHYFEPLPDNKNLYEWKSRFEEKYSERELQEIDKLRIRLMLESRKKHARAKDLFWRFFGHSLPYLWD